MPSIGRLLSQTKMEKTGKKGCQSVHELIASKKRNRNRKGRPRHGQLAYCSPKDEREKTENKNYRLQSIVESISCKKPLVAIIKNDLSASKIEEDLKLLNFFSRHGLPDTGIPSLIFLDIVPISRKARLID